MAIVYMKWGFMNILFNDSYLMVASSTFGKILSIVQMVKQVDLQANYQHVAMDII